MNKRILIIQLLSILLLASCISTHIKNYHFNQKTAPPQLKEDIVLLKKILEANHPSLYWYTPKDSIDLYFNNATNSINDSMTEIAFRNKVAGVISKIRCGHTAVRFSEGYVKLFEKNKYPVFPLAIKTWGDSMVVVSSYFLEDTVLKRGTIITSINGRSNKEVLDSMFQLISTDGYSNVYKSQAFSGNFGNWYKIVWGLDSINRIGYIDASGKPQTVSMPNYAPKKESEAKSISNKKLGDSIKNIVKPLEKLAIKSPARRQRRKAALLNKRSLAIDSTNTGYMRLTTFAGGHLRRFFRRSFRALKENKTNNLVIDLRENTGGYVASSNLFTKYLINKPFKNADTLAAITLSVKHPYYVRGSLKYWACAHFISRKWGDGRFHNRYGEKHFYQPKTKYHFDGQVYILQGGYTFSAATMFTATIKGQENVHIVGEESGGGNYGNTAMFMPTVILPNSKIRVVMPMFRLVMDAKRTKNGRGVMPDIYVSPSSEAIKKGIDTKLETARRMIGKGMRSEL